MSLTNNNKIFRSLFCLLLLAAFSCTDYGCIDADDYGEYDSKTYQVFANYADYLCKRVEAYKSNPRHTQHPEAFKGCFIQECTSPNEELKCAENCEIKCSLLPEKFKSYTTLPASSATTPPTSPTIPTEYKSWNEPPYQVVGESEDIILEEKSAILINAQGNISLSSGDKSNNVVIEKTPSSDNVNTGNQEISKNSNNLLRVYPNQNFKINFSGKIILNNGGSSIDLLSPNTSDRDFQSETDNVIASNKLNYLDEQYIEGSKRILVFYTKLPPNSSNFPDNFPIYPEPSSWQCSTQDNINGNGINEDPNSLKCSRADIDDDDDYFTLQNAKYNPNFQIPESQKANYNRYFSNDFPIDNTKQSSAIIKGTGFIRYNADNLYGTDTPFTTLPDNIKKQYLLNIDKDDNQIQKIVFPNNTSDFEIRVELSGSGCASSPTKFAVIRQTGANSFQRIKQTPSSGNEKSTPIYSDFDPSTVDLSNPSTLGESQTDESMSATYFIKRAWLNDIYIKPHKSSADCSTINVSFFKYHNIVAAQSGYVSFGRIGLVANENNFQTAINSNCNLRFRIINQDSSYEIINSDSSYIDPSNSLTSSNSHNYETQEKFFIRKGQTISFSPESWNGEWSASLKASSNITKKCGTEAYIKTVPYPAVFCSNYQIAENIDINSDGDISNNCLNPYLDPTTGKFIGCKEDYTACNSLKNGMTPNNKFCPTECLPEIKFFNDNCRRTYSATTDTISEVPTSCSSPTIALKEECIDNGAQAVQGKKKIIDYSQEAAYSNMVTTAGIASADIINYFNMTNCNNCVTHLISSAKSSIYPSPAITKNRYQCYDLENYTGSLGEIKTILDLSDANQKKTQINGLKTNKKLKNLDSFNGSYGNLYPLSHIKDNKDLENYPIISTKNSSFSPDNGYLSFFILGVPSADLSFNSPYTFNVGTKVKIFLESRGEKSNGENLHINLCYAAQANECLPYSTFSSRYGSFLSSSILKVIDYTDANTLGGQSNYTFSSNGYMYRSTPMKLDSDPQYTYECGSRYDRSENPISPHPLSNTLCFNTNHNPNDRSNNKRYRLMLKIMDPEPSNCNFNSPTSQCNPKPPCTSNCCDGWRIFNPNYNNSGNDYCGPNENDCTKKFICSSSPYSNNSGKYEVTVRTRRSSKIPVSKFINNIISPILQEIEGSDNLPDDRFTKNLSIDTKLTQIYNAFYDSTQATYLNESNTLSSVGEADYNQDRLILNKNSAMHVSFSPTNSTDFNVNIDTTSDPHTEDCKTGNCLISYIKFVSYGCQTDPSLASVDKDKINARNGSKIKEAIEHYCLRRSNCSIRFILDKTTSEHRLRDDNSLFFSQINNQNVPCSTANSEKFTIKYYYNRSTRNISKTNQVKRIYTEILNTPVYKSILTLSVTLMFTFYGMGFLMGVSELKQSEIFDRLIKVGLIYLFTHPQFGWVWFDKFFVTFFKGGTDFLTFLMASLFDDDSNSVSFALSSGNFNDKSALFWSVDRVVGLLLVNDVIHKKIGSLLFYNFYGVLYVVIIYYSVITYVYTISNAVLLYLTAQFFTLILFILGPIFFVFILFKQTKNFFDNWVNSLIGFSLQQIFLVFTLSIFNVLLYMIIKMTFGYKVCWDKVWKIETGVGSLSILSFWTPNDSPPYVSEISTPTTRGEVKDTIPTFPKLLSLWTVTVIMKSFVSTITDLAASLSGGMSASELGSGVAGAMNKMVSQVNNTMNKAYVKSGAQKLTQLADKKLFNSGALAKQERKEKRIKMAADQALKAKMENEGNKAVKDYKVNNAYEYSKMSDEQKRETLIKVKEDAMKKAAKDAGKSPKEIRELMNDKGLKNTSDTLLGGLREFSTQAIFSGGTLNSNLAQRSRQVDIGMTDKEIQKAANNMDPNKRKDFINGIESKDNKINKTATAGEKIKKGDIKEAAKETQMGKAYTNMQERKTAIKELESEGAIKKQSFDTSNAPKSLSEAVKNPLATMKKGAEMIRGAIERRSDSDEKKIQERMEKNRNNKEDKAPKKEFSSDNIKAFEAKANENDKKNK